MSRLEYNSLEIYIANCESFKNVKKIENVKKDEIFECRHLSNAIEKEKPATEVSVEAASPKSTPNDSLSLSKDTK